MTHTSDEALSLTCPFTRNREDDTCLGRYCMAWRWTLPTAGCTSEELDTLCLGYCGLAGKPVHS